MNELEYVNHFLGLFFFSGSLACFFYGLKLIFTNPQRNGIFFCGSIFIVSAFLFFEHYLSSYMNIPASFTNWNFITVFSLFSKNLKFVIGPLNFLFYKNITSKKSNFISDSFHFIPFAAIFILILFSLNDGLNFSNDFIDFEILLKLTEIASFVHMAIYFIYISIEVFRCRKYYSSNLNRILVNFSKILILIFAVICFLPVFWFYGAKFVEDAVLFLIVSVLLIMIYVPAFDVYIFIAAGKEIAKAQYSKSHLSSINLEDLGNKLESIMCDEKIFCDEDLTLKRLAENLDVTSHQLSEFLNVKIGKSFKSFVNSYRVKEAVSLIESGEKRNILNIAFSSGFNSKTAFYKAFAEETGVSPAEYRKRIIENTLK
ncbi:MAG: AraC family transcriptional regulator [Spirochaetes bacterium]|nr:AraC family transcriptional regulator [Spirochaetota bacterium]